MVYRRSTHVQTAADTEHNIHRTPLKPITITRNTRAEAEPYNIHTPHTTQYSNRGAPRPRHKRVYFDLQTVCTHRGIIGPRHVNDNTFVHRTGAAME